MWNLLMDGRVRGSLVSRETNAYYQFGSSQSAVVAYSTGCSQAAVTNTDYRLIRAI